MASGGKAVFNIGFKTDKSGLSEVLKQLQDIQNRANQVSLSNNATKQIKQDMADVYLAAKDLEKILSNSWNNKLNQLDLTKFNGSLQQSKHNLVELKNSLSKIEGGSQAFSSLTRDILNTNVQLKQSKTLLDDLAQTMTNTVKWGITSSIFNTMTDSIQNAWNYVKALDSSLNDIRIVTGKSSDEMTNFAIQANKAAKSLGAATKDYTNASLIYYQQGLNEQDVQARAQTTLKAANVTGQSGQEVSEQLTAVWNGYKVSAQEAELYIDKLAAVAADTAADLEELSTGMSKVASAANLMGVDIDELNAQLATIVSVTRQAPESVGTALKTIYARMGDIKAGLDDEVTLDEYTYQMGLMGVNVLNANGKLRDMGDVIQEVGSKWKNMSREQQLSLSQTMAGTRQYNNLLSLFDNWDMYTEALNTSKNAAGTLQEQQDTYMESTTAHLQQLSTEAEKTYDILFNQDTVNGFTDALTKMLSVFNSFVSVSGSISPLGSVGNVLGNIFSKQIARGISQQVQNKERLDSNKTDIQIKEEALKDYARQGVFFKDAGTKDVEESYRAIYKILPLISEEEQEQYLTAQKRNGEIKDTLSYYETFGQKLKNIQGLSGNIPKNQYTTQELGDWIKSIDSDKKTIDKNTKAVDNMQKYVDLVKDTGKKETELGVLQQQLSNINTTQDEVEIALQEEKIALLKEEYNTLKNIKSLKTTTQEEKDILFNKKTSKKNELTQAENLKKSLEKNKDNKDRQIKSLQSQIGQKENEINALKTKSANVKQDIVKSNVITETDKITEKSIKNLKEKTDKLNQSLVKKEQSINIVKDAMQDAVRVESGYIEQLEKEYAANKESKEAILKRAEQEKVLQDAIVMTTSAINILTTAYGIYKTVISEEIPLEDKFKQITIGITGIAFSFMQLIPIINSLPEGGLIAFFKTSLPAALGISKAGFLGLVASALPWIVIAAAIARAGWLIYRAVTADSRAIEELEEQIDKLTTTYNQAKEASENFKSSIKDYNESVKAINELTKGTQEYTEAIVSANQKAVELINANKLLAQYAYTDENGVLQFKQEGIDLINKGYTDKIINTSSQLTVGTVNLEREKIRQTQERLEKLFDKGRDKEEEAEERKRNQDLVADNRINTNLNSDKAIKALLELHKTGQTLTDENINNTTHLQDLSSEMQTFLIENKDVIMKNVGAIEASNKVIQASTKSIISTWLNTEESDYYKGLSSGQQEYYRKQYEGQVGEDVVRNQAYKREYNYYKDLGEFGGAINGKKAYELVQKYMATNSNIIDFDKNPVTDWSDSTTLGYTFTEVDPSTGEVAEVTKSFTEVLTAVALAAAREAANEATDKITKESLEQINTQSQNFISSSNVKGLTSDLVSSSLIGDTESISSKNANTLLTNFDAIKESFTVTEEMMNSFDVSTVEAFWEKYQEKLKEVAADTNKNIVLTALMSEELKELDYDEDDFKDYVRQLQTINEELETNEELAKTLALQNIKLNKGLEDLGKTYEDNENILKSQSLREANKHTAEYGEAIANMQQALEKVFGTKPDSKFIEDNFEQIKKLAEGDISVLDELQKKFATLKLLDPEGLNLEGDFNSTLATVQNLINNAQLEDLKVGMSLDDAKLDTLAAELQNMIYMFGLTAADANAILESIGFTPSIEYLKIPIEQFQASYDEATHTYTDEDGNEHKISSDVVAASTSEGIISLPIINSKATTVAASSSGSGINRTNTAAGKAEKKGGSEKKPDKKDPIEEKKDVYHDINIILKQISTELDRLEKQEEKLVGQDLIDNLNEQWGRLQDTIDATNEKIRIARGEMSRLQGKLGAKGVTFNPDGTIANYAAAYDQQLATVNAVIAHYNSLSAEAQEGYKATVEQAEKNWEEFLDNISEYDELVSEMIPELEDEIQAAIDEQIEIQIEKFNMEIELRLDMAEAEREWNEFKKRIIDDIEDDDILGNASAKLLDYSSYYKEDGTGVIQKNTQHVNEIIEQLKSIEATGTSSIYGDNEAQALEDLKTYYEQLMSDLTDVHDLIDEIRESYLDMMDEAQEKFDEQVETYEYIRDLLTHDMDLITMVYGDEAYDKLVDFYEKQEDNYNKQLDFQRQQKDFWKAQMDSLEEGSDEWQKAKENWMSAVEEWNSLVEEAIENLQDKYLNAINNIFANLNDKVTGGLGLDYVEQEWDLINKNADQYLDTINAVFETQQLESKYLDAIDNTDNISAQQKLNDLMKEEIAALEQKDKLTQYDIDRANLKYEIALKQIALEEAQQTKSSMRLRRDSQGNYRYEFVADNDAIAEAEDELSVLQNQLYNMDVEQYRGNLDQLYEIYVEWQEALAEAAQINDPEARAERELMINEQYGELINGIVEENEVIRTNLRESAFDELVNLHQMELEEVEALSQAEKDIMLEDMIPQWTSGVQTMADAFAGEGGFIPTCKDALNELDEATKEYEDDLVELQYQGGFTFNDIVAGENEAIYTAMNLLQVNNELINSYKAEFDALNAVLGQLNGLINQYGSAQNAANNAAEAAYKYADALLAVAAAANGQYSGKGNYYSGGGTSSGGRVNNPSVSNGGGSGTGNTNTSNNNTSSNNTSPALIGPIQSYTGQSEAWFNQHIKPFRPDMTYNQWKNSTPSFSFATGGYTGEWNSSEGKIGILHQKELILNQRDTENILGAVEIMRHVTNSIDNSIFARVADFTSGIGVAAPNLANEALEQNVHIEANFPNVQNSNEVEEALNNLVNIAAQRANRNSRN